MRHVEPGPPVKVTYGLTAMGSELQPALAELKSWARHWLAQDEERRRRSPAAHAVTRAPYGRSPYALRTAAASSQPEALDRRPRAS